MINKIKNMIKRAIVTNPGDDSKNFPITQIKYFEKTADAEAVYPYGFGANAPKGAVALVFAVNGDESNRAAIVSLPQSRIKNLKPGECYMSNLITGDAIIMREGGIEIISNNPITINGPVVVNGNVQLGGAGGQPIARVGDTVVGGVITSGSANHTAT